MSGTTQSPGERLNWADVWVLYQRELRCALRERAIVINSILIPVLLYPFLLWATLTGITYVTGQSEGFVCRVAVPRWPEGHPKLRLKLEHDSRFTIVELADLAAATNQLRAGTLDGILEFNPATGAAAALPGNFVARITSDGLRERSSEALERLRDMVDQYRQEFVRREGRRRGISAAEWQVFTLQRENTATQKEMGAFILGLVAPVIFVVMVAMGCFYPAVDCTAGERERGTWETLMSSGPSRLSVVAAKYLYVTSVGGLAGMLNLVTIALTMKPVFGPLFARTGKTLETGIPLAALPVALVAAVLLAGFIGAGMMLFAVFARTFKEGQAMITPFYMVTLVPVMFLQVPGLTLTHGLALIPIVNVTLMVREALSGTYHWPQMGVAVLASLAFMVVVIRMATGLLAVEDLIAGSHNGSLLNYFRGKFQRQPSPKSQP